MNCLNKTKTYLVGHMQYTDGSGWRKYVRSQLEPMGITVFDPYDKPFVKDVDEGREVRKELTQLMQEQQYDDVQARMRQIRIYDLNLVDRSDFIIAHIIPDVASWGSAEELVTANRAKKPIFLSVEGGKKATPLWLLGMIPHQYIYDSLTDIVSKISAIDSGYAQVDNDRWRLLKPEYR